MPLTIASGHSVTCLLDPDPANVARARDLARQVLAEWRLGDLADVVALVVSELVTNALRHGAGTISVRLCHVGGVVRTEVHDHGPGRPVRRDADASDEDGRGLALIAGLAELHDGELGMTEDHDGPGKTVSVTLTAQAVAGTGGTPVTASAPVTAIPRAEPAAAGLPELAPAPALAALRNELAASGLAVTGMRLTRLGGTITLPGGFAITCRRGWLWWRSGRQSSRGRPLHAHHPAGDPAGAARRLATFLAPDAWPAAPPARQPPAAHETPARESQPSQTRELPHQSPLPGSPPDHQRPRDGDPRRNDGQAPPAARPRSTGETTESR